MKPMRFKQQDQSAFATLSGDFNPIHVDTAAARRVAVGMPVVHGMHVLLQKFNDHFTAAIAPIEISARFERPVVVGDVVHVERSGSGAALTLDGGSTLAAIEIRRARIKRAFDRQAAGRFTASRRSHRPRVLTLHQIEGASGSIKLQSRPALRRRFPRAARIVGPHALAAMAAISRLVGMECPGRDSLLSALSVFIDRREGGDVLHWRVIRVDQRFGLVRMEVEGGGVHGTVDAFIRPAPRDNPTIATVSRQVSPEEFIGQRALIVGGSRGLGAATALIVAAGGGRLLATFAAGRAEATALERDVEQAGHHVDFIRFDVVRDGPEGIAKACRRFQPTHVYYFATPRIFARRFDQYDPRRFNLFTDFYVSGFAAVCEAAHASVPALRVLFPSTVALDGEPVRDLAEYVAAKAAGEALCRSLVESKAGLDIMIRRLPRVSTDQTASIIPFAAADAVAVMLPIVRAMHGNGAR